jgi:hypothetical protein
MYWRLTLFLLVAAIVFALLSFCLVVVNREIIQVRYAAFESYYLIFSFAVIGLAMAIFKQWAMHEMRKMGLIKEHHDRKRVRK